jgi:hypothetical protein
VGAGYIGTAGHRIVVILAPVLEEEAGVEVAAKRRLTPPAKLLDPATRRSTARVSTVRRGGGADRPAGMPKSSRFRGVTLFRPTGKWRAQISLQGCTTSLGDHDTEEDAARAFDRAAIHFKGQAYAATNYAVEEVRDLRSSLPHTRRRAYVRMRNHIRVLTPIYSLAVVSTASSRRNHIAPRVTAQQAALPALLALLPPSPALLTLPPGCSCTVPPPCSLS